MPFFFHNLFDRLQEREEAAPPGLPLKAMAGVLAGFYGLGARTRRALYAQGWFKPKRLPAPVISVGNLSVGGTGKTPMVACLARLFQRQGQKVAILSRGYGGTAQGVTCISDGSRIYARPPEVGEEAFWLARVLPGAAVYTAPARYAAGLAAWRNFKPDFFVLDDGFQHFQLHRDLDVVLLDAQSPFGNGRLLPRGPLREPVSTLAGARVLILTRFRVEQHQDRLQFLQKKFPGKTVLTATILPTKVFVFPEDREMPWESLYNQKLLAFAGLARPRVFFDTLRDLGVDLQGSHDFPDHYAFPPPDLNALIQEAQSQGARGLITTTKDWSRLGEKWTHPFPLWVLEVEARLEKGGEEKIFAELGNTVRDCHRLEACATRPLNLSVTPLPQTLKEISINPVILRERSDRRISQKQDSSPSGTAQKDKSESLTYPLPPEVKQRFQELAVRGKWTGDPAAVRRILVRAPNWVGDAVMSLPTLAGVHQLFPQAEITVLAAPRVAPLFAGIPGVAEVVVYPPGLEKWRTLWHLCQSKTIPQLTENRKPKTQHHPFDLGLAFPNSWEAALGLWLSGAKTRLGYDTQGRGPLLNLAVTGLSNLSGLHTVYYLLGILQGLGGVESFIPPQLYLQEGEVNAAAALLKNDQEEGAWVGLSPGAAFGPAKRWPPDRFAALGAELQHEFRVRLVLLGGSEDQDAAAAVKTRLPGALDLVGRTSLRQALGVLTHLKLLITNDSGLMHAAAALGVTLVAIFGSTDPVATGPFTDRATVLHHPLPCSPCLQRTCDREYQCLLDISVEQVLAAARAWLREGL